MAVKIFAVKNKATNQVERLVKAETRGQVNKHLISSVEIESVGAVDVVELMASGTLKVEDATAQAAGDESGSTDGVEQPAGTEATAA